jgi:hypothetical protein
VVLDEVSVGGVVVEFMPVTITDMPSEAFEGLVGLDFVGARSLEVDAERDEVTFVSPARLKQLPAGRDEAWWRSTYAQISGANARWAKIHQAVLVKQQRNEGSVEELASALALADRQRRAAEDLTRRLDRFAADVNVETPRVGFVCQVDCAFGDRGQSV